MFVERMEVLEYRRQKFVVELSTFPDFTNTETPRSLKCVSVCACLSEEFCHWISYQQVDRV